MIQKLIIKPKLESIPKLNSNIKEYGEKLWSLLDIDEKFEKANNKSGKDILAIIIKSKKASILEIPWELLYHPRYGFLGRNPKFTISREIPTDIKSNFTPPKEPLRVLFFSSLPDNLREDERLAIESEQVSILETLLPSIHKGKVELKIPNDGRFESFKKHIKDFKPHLVYLSGHGTYIDDKGYFLFEDKRGLKELINQDELALALHNSTVESVVLSACLSAKASDEKLKSGLARVLFLEGITHVIGMRESIYDKAGTIFAKYFIESLAKQENISIALQNAREEIAKLGGNLSSHWHLPLLISRDIEQPLIDWDFTPKPLSKEMTLRKLNQITYPQYFIGRRKEFREFYNYQFDNRLKNLLLFGEGGIGKSALVAKFGVELIEDGYRVFDYSLKYGGDFKHFLLGLEEKLSFENMQKYNFLKDRHDEKGKAKLLFGYLQEEFAKITFIFDNLEDIQNRQTKEIEDKEIRAWIEVISDSQSAILLMTSRWLLPNCKNSLQLTKPLYQDFLYYISLQNIEIGRRDILQKAYDTLGGNYRGVGLFIKAIRDMNPKEEEGFLTLLSNAKKKIKEDMMIAKILSYLSEDEDRLLRDISIYKTPIPIEGIRKISNTPELIESLISFSLIEKSYSQIYLEYEYQISSLVYDFIKDKVVVDREIQTNASEFQLYLFLEERKTLTQALIAYNALKEVNEVEKLEEWLFDETKEDRELRGLILNELGLQYDYISEYDKALEYYEKSLKISVEVGDKSGEGATLNNISQIYKARGDLTKALEYLEKSLKISVEIGDKVGEAYSLNNISQIYKARGDLTTGLEYLKKAYTIYEEVGYKKGQGMTLNNISQIFKARGDLTKALEYLEKSLKISVEIGDKSGEGSTLNNIALVSLARGDLNKSLEYLEKSLKIRVEIGDKSGICYSLFNIGYIHWMTDNKEQAKENWINVYQLSKQIGLSEILNNLENLAGQIGIENGLDGWEMLAEKMK